MDLKAVMKANADRIVALGLLLIGGVSVVLGWFGVSGTGLAAAQIPYLISGGIGGLALVIIGCTVWISADLQDEWRRLDTIDDRLAELTARADHLVDGQSPRGNGRGRSPRPRHTASEGSSA